MLGAGSQVLLLPYSLGRGEVCPPLILAHVVFELTGLPATELFPAPPSSPLSRIHGEGIFPFLAFTPYAIPLPTEKPDEA